MKLHVSDTVIYGSFMLTAFSTAIVSLRLYCRWIRARKLALHDYIMVAALLVAWGHAVCSYYQFVLGARVRFSNADGEPLATPRVVKAVSGVLITWWAYRIIFCVNLYLVKLSILVFYLLIAAHRAFRRAVWTSIVLMSVYTVGMVMASVFQCRTPSDAYSTKVFYDGFKGIFTGKCFDPRYIWWVQAGVNLVSDLTILVLPIPSILGLQMRLGKRLALIAIFSLGCVAILASCVRVGVLFIWAESTGNASRFGGLLVWVGEVEVNAGIISASIPFLRPLIKSSIGSSDADEEALFAQAGSPPPHSPPPHSLRRQKTHQTGMFSRFQLSWPSSASRSRDSGTAASIRSEKSQRRSEPSARQTATLA